MKRKTIKSVLRRKFNEWAASIDDDALRDLVKRDSLITGGSIVSLLTNEKVNDYDIYFTTRETALAVARYYVAQFKNNPPKKFKDNPDRMINIRVVDDIPKDRVRIEVKSAGIAGNGSADDYEYFEANDTGENAQGYVDAATEALGQAAEAPQYKPVFLSSNAITLSDKIQIVIRFYGPVDEIHKNYDFIHCTCSWQSGNGELILPPAALEAIINKDLHYMGGSKYPLCSIIRTRKFFQRGWKITAGQYVKMAWDLGKLDLSDVEVLEDQMVGVDSAYFEEVISLLRKHMADTGSKTVDESYLMTIIDRVF